MEKLHVLGTGYALATRCDNTCFAITNDHGTLPTGADLQYSDDQGATWTDFASPRTSATQYDAPGGDFPSGVLLWRVRSLNAEGTAGPWSEAVSFLCFAAPDPPILDSDGKPFLTVINSRHPQGKEAALVRQPIREKFGIDATIFDCQALEEADIQNLLQQLLYAFPLQELKVYLPRWLDALEEDHPLKAQLYVWRKKYEQIFQ